MREKTYNHSFDIAHASILGLIPAIVLNQFEYLLKTDVKFTRVREGKRYYRMTLSRLRQYKFPYLSEKQIRASLDHLESNGFLISRKDSGPIRTKMYALGEGAVSKLNKQNYPREFEFGLPLDSECDLDLPEADESDENHLPCGADHLPCTANPFAPEGKSIQLRVNQERINQVNTPLPPKGGDSLESKGNESVENPTPACEGPETSAGPPAAPRADDLLRLFKAYHPRIKRQPDRTIARLWTRVLEDYDPTDEEINLMVSFIESYRKEPKGVARFCSREFPRLLKHWSSQLSFAVDAIPPENDMTPYKAIVALYEEFQTSERNNWCVAPIPTAEKRAQLRKIWKEDLKEDLKYLRQIWQRCSDCKQLSRNEDFGKFFHLTWIFEGDHFSKLLEGRYDNK